MDLQDRQTEIIRKRYNRTSLFYDSMDRMISTDLRKKVLSYAQGKVLEVGVGTGKNLPYYPPECDVTGIDFSPGMLEKAKKLVATLNRNVTLLEMDAQNMSFLDSSFDTVLATCVFCSVPDPLKGLREVKRVCKPDGNIILLEHVRSDNPVFGTLMDLLNPISVRLIGANINRETVKSVSSAGIHINSVEDISNTKIIKLILASPTEQRANFVH